MEVEVPMVPEPPVPLLEFAEPEPNGGGVSRFRFRTGNFLVFFTVFHVSEPPAWFPGFRRFRHGFGLKNFEPKSNHGSKIDGFGSEP